MQSKRGYWHVHASELVEPGHDDGGWGYIIRNSDGHCRVGRLPYLSDPFQAELVACLQGIQAAIDIGITRIVVEIDAVMVELSVEAKDWGLLMPGRIILEIQELARLNFVSCIFFCCSQRSISSFGV